MLVIIGVDDFRLAGDESEARSGGGPITQALGGGWGACPPFRHSDCRIHRDSLRSSLKGFSHSAGRKVKFDGFSVSGNTVTLFPVMQPSEH